jgi:hypothetical protein
MRAAATGGADAADIVSLGSYDDKPPEDRETRSATGQLSGLYPALMNADDRGDVQALARHGWLPSRDATPLQLLAAPNRSRPARR